MSKGVIPHDKLVRRMNISGDDSSDEEDSVQEYSVSAKFKEYSTTDAAYRDLNHVLSFVSHAAGIYVLYMPEVQARYYALKEKHLSPALKFKTTDEIKNVLESTSNRIFHFSCKQQEATDFKNVLLSDVYDRIVGDLYKYCAEFLKCRSDGDRDAIQNTELWGVVLSRLGFDPYDKIHNFSLNFSLPHPVVHRKTLSSDAKDKISLNLTTTAHDNWTTEFLSHLRLHNRSEKRHLDNGEKCKDTTVKMFSLPEVKLTNASSFNQKGCRKEVVEFANESHIASYSKIFAGLTTEEIDFTLIITHRLKMPLVKGASVNSDTMSLWYLLFGCEVIKNPAALIHHNMALDLVEAGKLQLGDLPNYVPMMAGKVIQKAMALNQKYNSYMPHKYLYQRKNDYAGENALVTLEAKLTKLWLEYKLSHGVASKLLKDSTNPDVIEAIWLLVFDEFDHWGLPKSSDTSLSNAEKLVQDGIWCTAKKHYWQAFMLYDKAIKLKPDLAVAYHNKGSLLQIMGFKNSEIIKLLDDAITHDASFVEAHLAKANILYRSHRYDDALEEYALVVWSTMISTSARDKYTFLSDAFSGMSLILAEKKQYDEALLRAEEAIILKQDNHVAHYHKGLVLQHAHFYQTAVHAYDEAIRHNPDYARAYSNKAAALSSLGEHEESLKVCTKAVKLYEAGRVSSVDDAAFRKSGGFEGLCASYCNMVENLNALERFEEAKAYVESARRLNKDHPIILYNFGNTLLKLNQQEAAIAMFDSVIDAGSEYEVMAYCGKVAGLKALNQIDQLPSILQKIQELRIVDEVQHALSLGNVRYVDTTIEALTHLLGDLQVEHIN